MASDLPKPVSEVDSNRIPNPANTGNPRRRRKSGPVWRRHRPRTEQPVAYICTFWESLVLLSRSRSMVMP